MAGQLKKRTIDDIAARTGKPFAEGGAYMSDGFADWRGCVALLIGRGYSAEATERVLRSKHMRWCSDVSKDKPTVDDFAAYLDRYRGGVDEIAGESPGSTTATALWLESHRREALRRTFELAPDVMALPGPLPAREADAEALCAGARHFSRTEEGWRRHLATAGLSAARIDREVKRVRDFAEGRKVRETDAAYVVRRDDGETPASFMTQASANGYALDPLRPPERTYKIVRARVTRIRMVSK